jgi:hypothetical protein
MMKDYDKQIFDLNSKWDEQMKAQVDKRDALREKEFKLKDELQALQESIFGEKRKQDDQLRDLETRAREDEYSKYHTMLMDLEGKIRAKEDERVFAQAKYYDTVNDVQQQMKRETEKLVKTRAEIEKLQYDNLFGKRKLEKLGKLLERQ